MQDTFTVQMPFQSHTPIGGVSWKIKVFQYCSAEIMSPSQLTVSELLL